MKVIVVGATGTIGAAVVRALSGKHEVISASRKQGVRVDLDDPKSVRALFDQVKDVDAVVSCAGNAKFGPLTGLTEDDFAFSIGSKLMGQVNLARAAIGKLRDGGSITLTSGVLAQKPMQGSAAISLVNAGLEGFVRAAALEIPRGLRINVVSPPWVTETLEALKMQGTGLRADVVAKAYVAAVEGKHQGETLDAQRFA